MRWLKYLFTCLTALYLLACGLLFFFQEQLLFHPRARTQEHSYGQYAERWISLEDGTRLHALFLPARVPTKKRRVVLFLHGNVGDNGRARYQTRSLEQLPCDRLLVDYRGFGKSEGTISSEKHLTDDLQQVYDLLKAEYGEENIFVAGYSLGSGPASFLAAHNQPAGVILLAPYTSLVDMKNEFFWMFPDFILKYALDNRQRLANSTAPVHILHGTNDELIPFRMAEALAALSPARIALQPLVGVTHRGAVLHPAFGDALAGMLEASAHR